MGADQNEMACQALVQLVTDYLDGSLPPDDVRRFEDHLGNCPGCRNYLDQIRETVRLSGHLRTKDVDPEILDRLLDAFRDWNN